MAKVKALRSFVHKGLHERGSDVEMIAADAKRLAAKGVVEIMAEEEAEARGVDVDESMAVRAADEDDDKPRRGRKAKAVTEEKPSE